MRKSKFGQLKVYSQIKNWKNSVLKKVICLLRPEKGLSPIYLNKIVKLKSNKYIKAFNYIKFSDFKNKIKKKIYFYLVKEVVTMPCFLNARII